MTTLAEPIVHTLSEAERLAWKSGRIDDVGNGVPEKTMSIRANLICARLTARLCNQYPPDKAYVLVEQPTYCFEDPREYRRPDVALVWAERLAGGEIDDELRIAPDLVVEIVSPTNKYSELSERLEDFLDAGVPLVLVIDPSVGWVTAYRPDGSTKLFRAGDILEFEPLLPGFSLRLSELFPIPTPATP